MLNFRKKYSKIFFPEVIRGMKLKLRKNVCVVILYINYVFYCCCACGRFAPLATLVDEDADLDSMVTHFNKAVTDTAASLLGKQRRKRKPWVTPEILDLCDQRRDLKKKRGEPEGAKDYRKRSGQR